jgi:G3E family GTPase
MPIAVIENEFGKVGIDDALVLNADEEVFDMNNGYICCTVRGDLIRGSLTPSSTTSRSSPTNRR